MQISGFETGHNSDMHHVGKCMHNHKHAHKIGSAAGGAGANASPAINQNIQQQSQEAFSWSAWLRDPLESTKKLLGRLWGSNGQEGNATTENVMPTINEPKEVIQQILEPTSTEANSLNGSMADEQHILQNNPYFSTVEDTGRQKQNFLDKIRVRFRNVTGFLTKHFASSGRNAFQAKQERPKEDLSRHSRYRKDELEVECILTDDSYLMDSYNNKGEYSKLSAEKK